MAKKVKLNESGSRITIIAAVITAIATIAVPLIAWRLSSKSTPQAIMKTKIVGRVKDSITEIPIRNAKVSLEAQDVPPIIYTDSEGIFSFSISVQTTEARIRVEASGYEKFDRRMAIGSNMEIEDVRLQPSDSKTDKTLGIYPKLKEHASLPAQKAQAKPSVSETPKLRDSSVVKSPPIPAPQIKGAADSAPNYEVTLIIPSHLSNADIFVDERPAVITDRQLTVVKIRVAQKDQPTKILLRKGEQRCAQTLLIHRNIELTPCQ